MSKPMVRNPVMAALINPAMRGPVTCTGPFMMGSSNSAPDTAGMLMRKLILRESFSICPLPRRAASVIPDRLTPGRAASP